MIGVEPFPNFESVKAKKYKPTNWVVKALVEATPISVPALVWNFQSVSRIMALEATLQMAKVLSCPKDFACLRAAKVSAVSPDCETTTTKDLAFGTLTR